MPLPGISHPGKNSSSEKQAGNTGASPFAVVMEAKLCYDIVILHATKAGRLSVLGSHRDCQLNKVSW